MDGTPPILGWVLLWLSDRGGMARIHVKIVKNASYPLNFYSEYSKLLFSARKLREIVFEEYVLELLCFIDPRMRKIRNEASSCPGIFSRTLRFSYVVAPPALHRSFKGIFVE